MKQLLPPVPYATPLFVSGGKLSVPWTGFFKQLSAGWLNVRGTNTNDSADSGYIGEYLSKNSTGPNVAATGTLENLASLSLTAGDWEVDGMVAIDLTGFTVTGIVAAISTSSAAMDSTHNGGISKLAPGASPNYVPTGTRRISLSDTTTIYLVGSITYSAGSGSWSTDTLIRARRVR